MGSSPNIWFEFSWFSHNLNHRCVMFLCFQVKLNKELTAIQTKLTVSAYIKSKCPSRCGNNASHQGALHSTHTKAPARHAFAWQIGPFWQDTLDMVQTMVQCTLEIDGLRQKIRYTSLLAMELRLSCTEQTISPGCFSWSAHKRYLINPLWGQGIWFCDWVCSLHVLSLSFPWYIKYSFGKSGSSYFLLCYFEFRVN